MGDKNLSEQEWKKFSKGRDLNDGALVKALGALEKAKTPELALVALDDLGKQSDALRKSAKSDKELAKYLDDLDKALDKERKTQDAEAKRLAKQGAARDSGDEEDESPALLTTKMVPLLRQVKRGEEMQVLLASGGKEVAVMLSRRAISPSKRKLLSDYLVAGTPKFFVGTCLFEENAYTFVLKTQAAGMAKKLKAALLKQVELRLKVRVRGEDPGDIDDDGEEAPDEQESEDVSPDAPQASVRKPAQPGTPEQQADPIEAQFKQRWTPLEKRIVAALRAGAGDVSKIRAVAEFVGAKAQGGQYKAALQGVESLEKLLEAVPTSPAAQDSTSVDQGAAFNARLAALLPRIKEALANGGAPTIKALVSEAGALAKKGKFAEANELMNQVEAGVRDDPTLASQQAGGALESALAEWRTARSQVIKDLRKLGDVLVATEYPDAKKGIILLQSVIKNISEEPRTLQSVAELQRYLETDSVISDIESPNQLGLRIDIRKSLSTALWPIKAALVN